MSRERKTKRISWRLAGELPKYETPEEFEEKANEYFQACIDEEVKPIITELAHFMGFATRQSIYDYEKKPEFAHVAKRAKLVCEIGYERQLADGRGDQGVIFGLKNYGWSDKQEIEHSEKVVDSGDNEW